MPSAFFILNVDKRKEDEQPSYYHESGMRIIAKYGRAETWETGYLVVAGQMIYHQT